MRKKALRSASVIDAQNSVVKKYDGGRVFAVRFAPGMSESEIRKSIARDLITAKEWRPYDESTNTFLP